MDKITIHNIKKLLKYSFIGLFTNIKWETISIFNILKIFLKSRYYKMFSYENSLIYYFYDINNLLLSTIGRYEYSSHISNSPFLIGRWFHLSKLSLFPFCKNSILTVFTSWLVLLIYPLYSKIYEFEIEIAIVIFLTLFSSIFFNQLKSQNYNIVGWIFFYPFIEAISLDNRLLIIILSIILFETSITAFVIGSFFLVSSFIFYEISIYTVLLNFLFVSPFVFIRILPLIKAGIIIDQFRKIFIFIGSIKGRKSVKRKTKSINQLVFEVFNFFVLLIFSGLFVIEGKVPFFLILSIIIYSINTFLLRFADPESTDICIIICSIFSLLNLSNDFTLIFFYWFFVCNPVIEAIFEKKFGGKIEEPIYPVKINDFERELTNFYSKIESDQKIFFPCEDPKGIYENILDKHNILLNPLAFFALKNKILLFPYYFSFFDDNSFSNKFLWGSDSKNVILNMQKENFNYVLIKSVYLENDPGYSNYFQVISKLNWKKIYPYPLKEINSNPIWYLLKLDMK